jgi:hypothetical protein
MSDYTLGKVEFERHADAVMTSLADSVVKYMSQLDEANARIAVLEQEQQILARERDEALAAVTEGGTGNSGVERPEPSPHFSETVAFLRAFNRWRRGDETLEQPCPQEIGEAVDAACDEIERLERERDEARDAVLRLRKQRAIARNFGDQMERERDELRADQINHENLAMRYMDESDEARAALLWAVEWLDTITGRFPEDGSVNEMFAELAKDRLTNKALDATWNEVGWTQAVAKEVRG